MFKIIAASSFIILSVSLTGVSNELLAAAPLVSESAKTDSKTPAEKKANTLQVQFKGDKFTIKSHDAMLGNLLKSVTEHTGVTFNIAEETVKHDRLNLKLVNSPSSEAIKAILADYNTLYVWDEHMKLLQVNVLGRMATNAPTPETTLPETPVAKSVAPTPPAEPKIHPKSASQSASSRIDSALKDMRSSKPGQQEAALDDLIGGDDPRIATAMLNVALNSAEAGGDTAKGGDLSSKAALSLWRHGVERGFADQETIDALKTLQTQGNELTSGLAKQALQDLNKNF